MTESTPKQTPTPKPKKAKTSKVTIASATPTTENATEPEAQPAQQQPEQPQRIKDAIRAHENAIDFIHTAIHRTDCAIQLLTRNGYFNTIQYLQQAKVHLRESERSCRSMIRTIRGGNQ